jgi:hypothetical protein
MAKTKGKGNHSADERADVLTEQPAQQMAERPTEPQPPTVPQPDPVRAEPAVPAKSREQLLLEHRDARQRRDAAALGSMEFAQGCDDVARIEVEIAAVERAMTPPRQ